MLSFIRTRLLRLDTVGLTLVFLGGVLLDQTTKVQCQQDMMTWENPDNVHQFTGRSIPVFSAGQPTAEPGKTPLYFGFNLTYSRNTGAAFSMLADLRDSIRVPFFYTVTVVAVIAIFFFFRSTPFEHRFTRFGLTMILSGAIGNFIDRLRWGYVVDFLDADWNLFGWRHDFAIFNVADVCINIGVICYIIDIIRLHRLEKKAAAQGNTTEAAGDDSSQSSVAQS